MLCNRKSACKRHFHCHTELSNSHHSTDYICCVQRDEEPRFQFPVPSKASNINKVVKSDIKVPIGFENILPVVTLDQEFLSIVVDVERFCLRFRQAQQQNPGNKLEPHDYDVTALRYRLVCMENARKSTSHKELVGDACRVGTLIFFKTVFDHLGCWVPSHKIWARPNKVLVEKLKNYITRLEESVDAARTELLELLLWLSFVGGLMQLEPHNRRCYNSHIAATAAKLDLSHFHEVKDVLERFFWIDWVHELSCQDLWEDCQTESESVKYGSPRRAPKLQDLHRLDASRSDMSHMSFLSFGKSFLVRL